jgi:hypothetical protein
MLVEDIINEQLIQEITRPNDREKAADYLKQRGYIQLGAGFFANVLSKPETPYTFEYATKNNKKLQKR